MLPIVGLYPLRGEARAGERLHFLMDAHEQLNPALKPVIAGDIPANIEVVEAVAVMFPSQSVEGLAKALELVINNPSMAEGLRAKAHARGVKEYTDDSVAEKTLELYSTAPEHRY